MPRDKGAMMYTERELAIWRSVYETCGASTFVRLIEESLDSYKRVPIYDWPTRLHVSEVGLPCAQVLLVVVSSRGLYASISRNYIEIGSRLTKHLGQQLRWHLVVNGLATDDMKEHQLGIDLGL